eukprot:CAMPEP_0167754690 /NCGR_PEP_ID=MMETSP0110_2-20121227/8410_1 /TAXON_ID=629695 /ORGANISM="Gymnochlora sp., Strain CCMP2014" /LENGTH=261 /DNA_ID=CAMNT_0007640597 /DNA_START=48 /DNA_END=833 /DNA_ORIENTATION=-
MASTERCAVGASTLLGVICALLVLNFSGNNQGALQSTVGKFSPNTRSFGTVSGRSTPWISNALSRQRKEETVAVLKENLEQSSLVFGMRYAGISVKQMEELRKKLPEDSKIRIGMNTLMKRAGEEVDGYANIKDACQGDNAWWFVGENVASGVKAYLEFEEELKKAHKADPENTALPSISGGCMDGEFLDAEAIKKLKNLPTRTELIAKIAGSVKAVPTKLARSLKQVPQKMAVGVSKLSEGDDTSAKIGDVFPKPEAAEA